MVYDKNTWQSGDVITSAKLNHLEDGLDATNYYNVTVTFTETPGVAAADKSLSEVVAAFVAGKRVIVFGTMEGGVEVAGYVTGLATSNDSPVAWLGCLTVPGANGPTGILLMQGGQDDVSYNIIPVS